MTAIDTLETSTDAPADPLPILQSWLSDAEASELNDPNAMSLATIDADGRPSIRMVLLKSLDDRGFVFFTNRESRKGLALAANNHAALNFHWKSRRRAVRVEGTVTQIDDAESDEYFNSRGRGSRLGAWASLQSQTLDSRTTLVNRVKQFDETFGEADTIPRPPHWGGYRVSPDVIEFWSDGADRLHTRVVYRKKGADWAKEMLYP